MLSVLPKVLNRSGAIRVPQHVAMNRKRQPCGFSSSGDCFQEARGRGGTTSLGDKNVSRFLILET
jgi:hypothetical protein